MSAIYTPPNYRDLYDRECGKTAELYAETQRLKATLRDQFATAALTGLVINNLGGTHTKEQDAKDAYEYADEMLKAREAVNG